MRPGSHPAGPFRKAIAEPAQGPAVLLTTHHTEDVERLADNVVVISEGSTVWSGDVTGLEDLAEQDTDEKPPAPGSWIEASVSGLLSENHGGGHS